MRRGRDEEAAVGFRLVHDDSSGSDTSDSGGRTDAVTAESPIVRVRHSPGEVYDHRHRNGGGGGGGAWRGGKVGMRSASGDSGDAGGEGVPLLSPSERGIHVSGKVHRNEWVSTKNEYRKNTLLASIITVINTCLGASLLVLPDVARQTGLVLFCVILAVVGFLASESMHLLTLCVKWTQRPVFQGLGRAAFGWFGAQATTVIVIAQLYGYMVAYLIVVGSTVQTVINTVPAHLGDHTYWQIGVSAVFVLPLCMLRRMQYLRFSAYFAIVLFAAYVVACVIDGSYQLFHWSARPKAEGDIVYFGSITQVLGAMPVLSCSYCATPNLFPILEEIRRPTAGRMHKVVHWGIFGTFIVYLLCGSFGYVAYLSLTQGDLLLNFSNDSALLPHAVLDTIGFCIGSAVLISVPMQCFELRANLDVFFFPKRQFTWLRHTLWTVGLVAATTTTAILIPQVETVFSFIGASCSNAAVFVLPGLFYLRLVPPGDTRSRILAWTVMLLGLVLIPLCMVVLTLQQLHVIAS